MPGDDLQPLTESSRRFLEAFLEQVRQADLPGKDKLIAHVEEVLHSKPGVGPTPEV